MTALTYITDWLGRYTRLSCPHCALVIRFRGVGISEELSLRSQMDAHRSSHHISDEK